MKQIQANRIEQKLDTIRDLLERLPDRITPIQKVIQRPTTDSQEEEFAEQMGQTEPEKWKPAEGDCYYTLMRKVVIKTKRKCVWYVEEDIWTEDSYEKEGTIFYDDWDKAWEEAYRRNEHLKLNLDEEVEYIPVDALEQREAAETPDPERSESEIQPAGPLREMPEEGGIFLCVEFYKDGYTGIEEFTWTNHSFDFFAFQAGLCFPNSEAGRLGAERRAKQGIIPPIDREELRKVLGPFYGLMTGTLSTAEIEFMESIPEGGTDHE